MSLSGPAVFLSAAAPPRPSSSGFSTLLSLLVSLNFFFCEVSSLKQPQVRSFYVTLLPRWRGKASHLDLKDTFWKKKYLSVDTFKYQSFYLWNPVVDPLTIINNGVPSLLGYN